MKNSLKITAVLAFAGTLFLNISFDSQGHFSSISQTQATAKTKNAQAEIVPCPDGVSTYVTCLVGANNCTPTSCPNN